MQFPTALARILRPLVRSMIARGMTYPDASDLLKKIFVERAQHDFDLEGKRMTDSRISLLTGLQRRDVRAHRTDETPPDLLGESAGPLPRVIARWLTDTHWCKRDGTPHSLLRTGDGLTFEALVASISRDMHARTLLDELQRQGAVSIDPKNGSITLLARSHLPSGDTELLGYFGANLGDHAEAAVGNLLSEASAPPFFERAVHYNKLSDASLKSLDAMARQLQDEALSTLNAEALRLQQQDAALPARGRFRCGAFVYVDTEEERAK